MAYCAWRSRRLDIRDWTKFGDRASVRRPSIAVVGNAGYLGDLNQGEFIDRHDLVLRMNNFRLEGFEPQVGRRVDIFMTNFYTDINYANPALRGARHIVASIPSNLAKSRRHGVLNRHREHLLAGMQMLGRTTVFVPGWERFVRLVQRCGNYPTTGAMAIVFALDLLSHLGGAAFITGFSFFEGRSHYFSDRQADTRNHQPAAEKQLLRELLAEPLRTGRVSVDAVMNRHLQIKGAA